jgi:hypothetical protein
LFDYRGFEAADARQTPARLSHFFHQKLFVDCCRREGAAVTGH